MHLQKGHSFSTTSDSTPFLPVGGSSSGARWAIGSVLCNYSLVRPGGNNSEALESRCSPETGCPLPLGCWQPGEPCQVAGWGNVKAQIKPRALKSHETAVMRKVTGSGGVWTCLAGRRLSPLSTLLSSSCLRMRRLLEVFVYLTFLILDLGSSSELNNAQVAERSPQL